MILKKLLRRDSKKPICIDQKDKMCHPGHQTAASRPIPVSDAWNAATKRVRAPSSWRKEEGCLVRWEEATRDGLPSDMEAECHVHKAGKCWLSFLKMWVCHSLFIHSFISPFTNLQTGSHRPLDRLRCRRGTLQSKCPSPWYY